MTDRSKKKVPTNTDGIVNLLNDGKRPLREIVDEVISHGGNDALAQQIDNLRQQIDADETPSAVKPHLMSALSELQGAQEAAKQPLLQNVANAILVSLRGTGVPLQIKTATSGATKKSPTRRRTGGGAGGAGGGENQQFILSAVKAAAEKGEEIRPSDIKTAAEEAGLNVTSVGQAVRRLVKDGAINEVGDGKRNRPLVPAE